MKKKARLAALLLVMGLAAALSVAAGAETSDITLDQALELFQKNNFDIIIGRYEIDKARADLVGAGLLPNPSAAFGYTDIQFGRGGVYAGDNTQWEFRLEQLIEIGGKRGLRKSVAAGGLEAARLEHQDLVRNLLVGFYSIFNDLVLDDMNVAFIREEIRRFDKVLAVSDARHAAGFLTLIDHEKLKLSRVELESDLARFENQEANDLELFRALLGTSRPIRPVAPADKPVFSDYDADTLIGIACNNRADLLGLKKRAEAAAYGVRLARANGKPDLGVGVEYDSLGPTNLPAFGFGLSLDIPLFNRNQKEVLISTYELEQLRSRIEKTRRQIEADVRLGLNDYRSAFKIFAAYQDKEKAMDDLLERSRRAFALGGITVLEFLDTQKAYRDFELSDYRALVQCRLNQELLKLDTGGVL